MLKRYSVRNLDQEAIEMLREIQRTERREIGAILADCIYDYWSEVFADDATICVATHEVVE